MPAAPSQAGSLYTASGRRKYLTPSERARFIAAAARCDRLAVRTLCLVLAFTGCRISEALALTTASIEGSDGLIAFRCLKKRRGLNIYRQVPVPQDLLDALESVHILSNALPQERLWCWSRGRAWQLIKSVMASAEIAPGIHATPKGLRHGFGVNAIRSGVPLNLVQRWLGHSRLETTAVYAQALGNEEREIAQRMWQSIGAIPAATRSTQKVSREASTRTSPN